MALTKEEEKEWKRQWYLKNREKILIKRKEYAFKNREVVLAKHKQYYCDHKNERLEYLKKWQEENKEKVTCYKEKYKQTHKAEINEKNNKYCLRPEVRENINFHTHLKRSRQANLPSTLTRKEWKDCKKYFDNKCAYCGETKPLAKDHFVPVAKNGGYEKSNIIPACKNCNSSKNKADFYVWYPKHNSYSEERYIKILNYVKGNVDNGIYNFN
jgi:hypothetical protein